MITPNRKRAVGSYLVECPYIFIYSCIVKYPIRANANVAINPTKTTGKLFISNVPFVNNVCNTLITNPPKESLAKS